MTIFNEKRRLATWAGLAMLGLSVNALALDCDVDPDEDGDGYDAIACGGADCDDQDASRYPGNVEICDSFDEDCNLLTPGYRDTDGDGYTDMACLNRYPNGDIASQGSDCDDSRPAVNRLAVEICDGRDNNCDGDVDGDAMINQFVDLDLDGHGNPNDAMKACPETAGFSVLPNDCDDDNPAIQPGDQACVMGAPEALLVCDSSGQWVPTACPAGQVCEVQANGTGLCITNEEKDKKPKA